MTLALSPMPAPAAGWDAAAPRLPSPHRNTGARRSLALLRSPGATEAFPATLPAGVPGGPVGSAGAAGRKGQRV